MLIVSSAISIVDYNRYYGYNLSIASHYSVVIINVLKFAGREMAEAPDDLPEDNDVTEQVEENTMDPPADVQEKLQPKEAVVHQNGHQSQARATSSKKKKKKDKAASKKSDMANAKNLQELINKLSSMPSSLTAALDSTDGSSKGHEFWDTQPVPKLGNVTI